MSRAFARFADAVAEVWASAPWFALCAAFVVGWAMAGLKFGASNETWHLWLNSPTTGLTFLGMFLLHHVQNRFEKRTDARLAAIAEAVCPKDPAEDGLNGG